MHTRRLVVAILAPVVLAAACGDHVPARRPSRPQPPDTIRIDGEDATDRGTRSVSGPGPIALRAGSFYFEPTVITGPAGVEVQLDVTVVGSTTHNLSVPEQGIDVDLAPGQPFEGSVRFPETGTLKLFCSYHRGRGMLGVLTAV